jgi:hypothetical protein
MIWPKTTKAATGITAWTPASAITRQQTAPRFGGHYSGLDLKRQHFVRNWVGRFVDSTGQRIEPRPFYDEVLSSACQRKYLVGLPLERMPSR